MNLNYPMLIQFTPTTVKARIVYINDGDTFQAESGLQAAVRLAYIDAPEISHSDQDAANPSIAAKSQYKWGQQAKLAIAKKIIDTSNEVDLTIVGIDPYKRNIAVVRFSDGELWSNYLLAQGLAIVYDEYAANKPELYKIQDAAKEYKVGIWSDDNFILPSTFRKMKTFGYLI